MDVIGKGVIVKLPEPRRFEPSVMGPLELSERSDSSGLAKHQVIMLDQRRVNEAAAWIRAKVAVTLRRGAQDVGEYVLDTFFGGDPDLARSKNPQKNASYRALAAKCGTPELPISKTWLNNAVGVAVIVRRLPESAQAFKRLPPSYQETLLPLKDPAKVEMVARRAVNNDLSFRELRAVVAEERGRKATDWEGDTRALPAWAKAITAALAALGPDGEPRLASRDADFLTDRQKSNVRASAELLMDRLKDLTGRLG